MDEAWLLSFMAPKGLVEWVRRFNDERSRAPAHDRLRPDILATRYGKLYRASYWLKYVLASFAVCFAVAGLMRGQAEIEYWPALELASIVGVLLCFSLSRAGDWHERWLDYRLLAEQFRVLDFLHPLGETVPVYHPPIYWGAPPGRHACVRWYFRARLREVGLPNVVVGDEYTHRQRKHVLAVTRGQFSYNFDKHLSAELRHKVLEKGGFLLFAVTAVACIVHLGHWASAMVLGALTAALPAFGAAMEGLGAQEESKRIAGYALAMSKHLEDVERQVEMLPADASLGSIASIAFELATEMTRETSGWHNLIHGQPPRL